MKREMLKLIVLFLLLILTSFSLSAEYQHFLFIPNKQIEIHTESVNLKDDTVSVKAFLSGLVNGYQPSRVIYNNCTATHSTIPAKQSKTSWLLIPREFVFQGQRIRVSIDVYNGWRTPTSSIQLPAGYDVKIVQNIIDSRLEICWQIGGTVNTELYWENAQLTFTVSKQGFPPGDYKIPISFYYGYEEHKYSGATVAPIAQLAYILLQHGRKDWFDLDVAVRSRCHLNNYGPVSLSHGRMTSDEANGNKTSPARVSVTCDYNAPVKVELIGNQRVAGRTKNFTRCGSGGTCELTFNGGEYDKTYNTTGNLDIDVISTFHPNPGPAIEGVFSGSGVLKVIFE